jgi:hypothetical protein
MTLEEDCAWCPPLLFERALDRGEALWGDVQVSDRSPDVGMAEQTLEHEDIGALMQLVGGKAVTKGVDPCALGQASFFFAR